jgi:hypothetical protein
MKKFTIIFFLIASVNLSAQVQFQKVFGETVGSAMKFILPADSGVVLAGESGAPDLNIV